MTIVSFYEVDFTSDKTYLLQVSYVAGIRAIYELAGTGREFPIRPQYYAMTSPDLVFG